MRRGVGSLRFGRQGEGHGGQGRDAGAHGDAFAERTQDRSFRRKLFVRPGGHQGCGALVGKLGRLRAPGDDGRRSGGRIPSADRPLPRIRRRNRLPRRNARDDFLGVRSARADEASDRFRDGSPRLSSIRSSPRNSSRQPTTSVTAASDSTWSAAGKRASSICSAWSAGPTTTGTTTPRNGSTSSSSHGRAKARLLSVESIFRWPACTASPSRSAARVP